LYRRRMRRSTSMILWRCLRGLLNRMPMRFKTRSVKTLRQ
jgi:hypothetical protein